MTAPDAAQLHRRLLGNGHCTRPLELDCRFQTICEGCGFYETGPEFVTILRRQPTTPPPTPTTPAPGCTVPGVPQVLSHHPRRSPFDGRKPRRTAASPATTASSHHRCRNDLEAELYRIRGEGLAHDGVTAAAIGDVQKATSSATRVTRARSIGRLGSLSRRHTHYRELALPAGRRAHKSASQPSERHTNTARGVRFTQPGNPSRTPRTPVLREDLAGGVGRCWLVGLGGREPVGEGDRERVEGRLPAHCPSLPTSPGGVQ